MTVQLKQQMTAEDFEVFVNLPENHDRRFEHINGEVCEVPSNPLASKIAAKILTFIGMYLLSHDIGHVTGEGGGYWVGSNRYAPDVAYISYTRQPRLAAQGYNPTPPELAVEVISDPDNAEEQRTLRLKLTSYLAAGTLVWVVNPFDRTIEVHMTGRDAVILRDDDTLSAPDLLPGFSAAVRDIFGLP